MIMIIMNKIKPLENKLSEQVNRTNVLQNDVRTHKILLDKKNDEVKDLANTNANRQKEIENLTKALMNQANVL